MFRINLSRHLFRRKKLLLTSQPLHSQPSFLFSSQVNEKVKLPTENVDRFQRIVYKQMYFEAALFISAFAIGSYYFKYYSSNKLDQSSQAPQNLQTLFGSGSIQQINDAYEHQLLKVLKEVLVFNLMTKGEKSSKKFSHILGGFKGSVEKRKSYNTIKNSLTRMAALNREFIYNPLHKEKLLNPELFSRLKEFLVFKDTYVKNKIEEELGWMFGLFEEDVYRLLSILVSHYNLNSCSIMNPEDLQFFEKRMEQVIQGKFTGSKAAALRYFYNKEAKEKNYAAFGDCLYFGNEDFVKNGGREKGNLDILFIHGQGSHPVRGFRVKQEGQSKIECEASWPVEILKPEIEASGLIKARIYLALLESGRTQTDLKSFNVPERTTEELADVLEKEIRKHKIGEHNPLLIVGFSLGGIVAKRLMLRIKKDLKVKGVLFIGVPHKGSEVVDETLKEVYDGYSGYTTFETSAQHSITKEEFVSQFLDTCKLSVTSKEVSGPGCQKQLEELNSAYSALGVPSWCISEGKKIKSRISPKEYHLVKPDSALLETCVEKRHLSEKNHYDLASVSSQEDETVKITKEFVQKLGQL